MVSTTNETPPASKSRSSRNRLKWLLGGGLLLILLAAGYVHFYLYLPVGEGPAGPAVPLEPFESPWSDRKVLLLGIGDSVTAGLGSTPGHSYWQRLVENPSDEFADMRGRSLKRVLPNLETLNLAVSGSNSSQHLDAIQAKLQRQREDMFGIVVMTSGGNDLIHWYGRTPPAENAMYGATFAQAEPWIENYGQRLDAMLAAIKSQFPGGCLILLPDIYDPSDGYGDPESAGLPAWPDAMKIHAAYNATLREVAEKHPEVHVIPMHEEFLGHGIHCRKFWRRSYRGDDPHYWYAPNLEDPNDRGYDAIRRLMLLKLIELKSEIPR